MTDVARRYVRAGAGHRQAPAGAVGARHRAVGASLLRPAGRRLGAMAASLVVPVCFFLAWEAVVRFELIREFWISRPSAFLPRLLEALPTGEFWTDVSATMQATVGGLLIGVVAGTALGIVYGLLPTFSRLSEGLLMGLYSLPRVALAPLFMLWFGIGITSKVWLSVSLVLFVVLFNVRTGISLIDPKLVHTMRLMGGRRRDIVRRVTLPSLVPWLLSSARVGIGLSLMAVVVGEMISSRHGVGNLIAAYSAQFDAEGVMATLTFLGVVALFMTKVLGWLERHLTRWAATGEPTRPS